MKKKTAAYVVIGCLAAGVLGAGAGAASAQGLFVFTPAGLSADKGIDSAPAPAPSYLRNPEGLTYGSAAEATSPDTEPDLIAVEYADGKRGYVYKKDLDAAQGPGDTATPEEVLEWQATEGQKDRTVPVYEVDGKTHIGEFTIAGIASQATQ